MWRVRSGRGTPRQRGGARWLLWVGLGLSAVGLLGRRASGASLILDDFQSAQRWGWTDLSVGSGTLQQGGGSLQMTLPAQGRVTFLASRLANEPLTLVEGQPVELDVDVLSRVGGGSGFAVLAWAPTNEPLQNLHGYFLALSSNEVRVGRAWGDYLYAATPQPMAPSENVTLALMLTQQAGDVSVRARVTETRSGAVFFDQSFVDAGGEGPAGSVANGTGTPSLGAGHLTLMALDETDAPPITLSVNFANARASAPAFVTNRPPVLWDFVPPDAACFVPPRGGTGQQSDLPFKLFDDRPFSYSGPRSLVIDGLWLGPIGFQYVSGSAERVVQLDPWFLYAQDTNYVVSVQATDAAGVSTSVTTQFDTFSTNDLVIEAEDYNFGGGGFIDQPALTPEGAAPVAGAYRGQVGVAGVDFVDPAAADSGSTYRPADPVGIVRSLDYPRPLFVAAGGEDLGFYDYAVKLSAAGESFNYTRTFDEGFYEVFLRQSVVNQSQTVAALERVDGDPGRSAPRTTLLGWFLGHETGFLFRNVPLTDEVGRTIVIPLGGVETLRLRQVSVLGAAAVSFVNYMVLPVVSARTPVLESAAVVNGLYAAEAGAVVDTNATTVTVAVPANSPRFYRLRAEEPVRVNQARVSGGVLVIAYQTLGR